MPEFVHVSGNIKVSELNDIEKGLLNVNFRIYLVQVIQPVEASDAGIAEITYNAENLQDDNLAKRQVLICRRRVCLFTGVLSNRSTKFKLISLSRALSKLSPSDRSPIGNLLGGRFSRSIS